MATARELRMKRLQGLSQQFWQDNKNQLARASGANYYNPNAVFSANAPPSSAQLGLQPFAPPNTRPGQMDLQHGSTPSDAKVAEFINGMGGDPYMRQLQQMVREGKATPKQAGDALRQRGGGEQANIFEQLLQGAVADYQSANQANIERYNQGLGELYGQRDRTNQQFGLGMDELSTLRDLNQELIGNWGHAQEQLNKEKADEALSNQLANLASRGLSNSTIAPSFQARSARDLALVQQDLSEKRDQRKIDSNTADTTRLVNYTQNWNGADVRDTGNITGWIERRNDIGPDMNQIIQLSGQIGAQQESAEVAALRRQLSDIRNSGSSGRGGGGGGGGGGQPFHMAAPIWTNGTPVQQAQAMISNINSGMGQRSRGGRRRPANYEQLLQSAPARATGRGLARIAAAVPAPLGLPINPATVAGAANLGRRAIGAAREYFPW